MSLSKYRRWADLGTVVILTGLAVGMTFWNVSGWLLAAVAIPFLLCIPGYAVLAALFPRLISGSGRSDEGFVGIELLVLTVVTSMAVAIVVGVNIGFTPLSIQSRTVVGTIAGITVLMTALAAFRRTRQPKPEPTRTSVGSRLRVPDLESATTWSTIANVATILAIVVAVASVALVAATPQRGETYTAFGLLTERESGELVASGYPSELSTDEPTSLVFSVQNKEMQTVEYVVVVQLVSTGPDGAVTERTLLDTYRREIDPGSTWNQDHEIVPEQVGEDLRLTYLLYRGEPPEQPAAENAYRETHIWVDVKAE